MWNVGMPCLLVWVFITELYSLCTGIDLKPTELLLAADRCIALLKLFNIRQGATRKDDYIPKRNFTEPLRILGEESWMRDYYETRRLTEEDIEMFIDDYYEERGWDREGIPTRTTLTELELTDYVEPER
jgi:aldehyde:ferredoxin oxidoreductase